MVVQIDDRGRVMQSRRGQGEGAVARGGPSSEVPGLQTG